MSKSSEMRARIRSDIDLARALMLVRRYAAEAGFSEIPVAQLCTAASELGRNILKYAGQGTLKVKTVQEARSTGIELEAKDQGPGIEDIEAALQDHMSTGGTLGLGLPGVKRMMDTFQIESRPGQGTHVVVRKWR